MLVFNFCLEMLNIMCSQGNRNAIFVTLLIQILILLYSDYLMYG